MKNYELITDEIVNALKRGEVIVCPTESVYGLICDAKNKKAVGKIFKIKKRSFQKTISIFVKDINQAKKFAKIDKKQEKFLKQAWPGKTIAVLKANSSTRLRARAKFPKGIVCQWGKIGIRVPKYKLLNKVLDKFKGPIAQTSANLSGSPTSPIIKDVLKQFTLRRGSGQEKYQPDMIIDAGRLSGRPSKVVDLTTQPFKILRK